MKDFTQLAHIALMLTMSTVMLVTGDIPIGFTLASLLFFLSCFHTHLIDHQFIFLNSLGVLQHHLPQLWQLHFCNLLFCFHIS